MKWIAIREAITRSRQTLQRFPFVLLAGAACATFGLIAVDASNEDAWIRPLLAASLGLPLLFAIRMTGERRGWSVSRHFLAGGLAAAALVAFWAASRGWSDTHLAARYVQLSLAAHLLAAFLPFLRTGTLNGFWQYNRSLFMRFLLGGLYAGVLFAGLAVALLAVDNLLGVDVSDPSYARLWILLAFVFNPWFFLAGVPADLEALDRLEDYPVGLKVFAQFVLIPLVSVYLVILTAYLVRILVTQTWPSGWIGWLVSSVAAVGTLALLLVHPIRERADSRWVDGYGRWFYVALVPSIAMLLMAIWQRIDQYAFTENRYFLLVGSLWLAGVALYYGITGSRNIRVIPQTLCAIALLTAAGPWSAFSVSLDSQITRFRSILQRNEMLADGQLQRPPAQVPLEDRTELSAVLRYLLVTHGANTLARIDPSLADTASFAARSDEMIEADQPVAYHVMERLGLPYVNRWETTESGRFFQAMMPDGSVIDVSGFDELHRVNLMVRTVLEVDGDSLVVGPVEETTIPIVWRGQTADRIALDSTIEMLLTRPPAGSRPQPPIILDGDTEDLRLRLVITQLGGNRTPTGTSIGSGSADVLTGRR
ncbi:MAG: DUF4153 domain-containing protein [Gemmatimonadetes bacterium]|nr:DUF4153 domain-containing protein [Gemmatimonadota bacterium]